jgi:hypothetical protein
VTDRAQHVGSVTDRPAARHRNTPACIAQWLGTLVRGRVEKEVRRDPCCHRGRCARRPDG